MFLHKPSDLIFPEPILLIQILIKQLFASDELSELVTEPGDSQSISVSRDDLGQPKFTVPWTYISPFVWRALMRMFT